jgi:tRNA(fMet)-specific endonuclease VapC
LNTLANARSTPSALVATCPALAEVLSRKSAARSGGTRITLSELEYGVENSRFREQNRAALEDLTALIQVDAYPQQAARHFAEFKAALKAKGRPTKPYDLLIGAHARALDATLVTNDTDDFRHMPGLRLTNWLRA